MKLCIVTHKLIKGDGQGRVNYEIVKEAICRAHHVTLLATTVASELTQHSQVTWIPIPVKDWPPQLFRSLVFSWQSSYWLRQHYTQFDLIQVNGAITQFPGDVNAVHFVHTAWARSRIHTAKVSRNLYGFYQWIYTALNAFWEKQAFRQAKVVVAVSKKVQEELIGIGVLPEKIQLISNGVDLNEFHPGKVERHLWKLPEKVPLALFVGDIRSPRKNLDTVLHALVGVQKLHLAVVGNTQGSPYPQLATDLGIGGRVHFLGYRQDIAQIMQTADFLICPSRYEPFGLVLLEAMATGLPVITASSVGAADLVSSDCGFVLSDPENTQSLTKVLCTLTSHPDLKNQMGQAARTFAQQCSWTIMAQHYLDLFEKLNHELS